MADNLSIKDGAGASRTIAATDVAAVHVARHIPVNESNVYTAPATQTTAAAILAKIITSPATEAKQDTMIGHVDGIEAAVASTNTKLDSEAVLIGAVTETAPASDTASSGLNGRLQRIAQRITSMIALLPAALGQGTMAQSMRVVLPSDQSAIPVTGNVASGAADSGNPIKAGAVYNASKPTLTSGQRGDLQVGARGSLQVELFVPGSSGALPASFGDGLVVRPYALNTADWSYAAAASGIVNTTTAVTIKTAAGASVRNYITSIDFAAEALGAATELAIRDGAGGTVLWRTKIGTAGVSHINITFPTPIKSTANTLLEVVTLTASVTGAVYFNARGYTAA